MVSVTGGEGVGEIVSLRKTMSSSIVLDGGGVSSSVISNRNDLDLQW